MFQKLGLGGGCHWCTEAIFQSLKGVERVQQGWIATSAERSDYSEAVLVSFDPEEIDLITLVEIHLLTHASTSNHSFRKKYRSALYYLEESEKSVLENSLSTLQKDFKEKLVTEVYPLGNFKSNEESFLNYYQKRRDSPFCETHISPKLSLLHKRFRKELRPEGSFAKQ